MVANAQHEARALDERAQSEVAVLEQERAELVADLKLIKNWINTAG